MRYATICPSTRRFSSVNNCQCCCGARISSTGIPANSRKPQNSRADFLSTLSTYLARDGESTAGAEALMRAVFRFLERKASDGEIEDVRTVIPRMLDDLWPRDLRAA